MRYANGQVISDPLFQILILIFNNAVNTYIKGVGLYPGPRFFLKWIYFIKVFREHHKFWKVCFFNLVKDFKLSEK